MVELAGIITLVFGLLLVASLAACFYFFWRMLRYGQVLTYRPRRRVPWGMWGLLVALAITGLSVMTAISQNVGPPGGGEAPLITSSEFAFNMIVMAAIYLAIAAGLVIVLVALCGAGLDDLGLPRSSAEWSHDVGLGLLLGIASVVPVYILQVASVWLLGIGASHPILDRIQEGPDMLVVAGGLIAALIAAPLFEEVVYRLLLIGALERWEDETIDWPYSDPVSRPGPTGPFEPPISVDADLQMEGAIDARGDTEASEEDEDALPLVSPGAVAGLNHGWFPILCSAFLFSLAHLGQGPSPIPLFAFAIILGYAFQRTRRLIPCVVAHLVFNGISIGLLVVTLYLNDLPPPQ